MNGSSDSDIILCDLPGEAGLVRTPAHNSVVTAVLRFHREGLDLPFSAAKDGLLKAFGTHTQHYLQILAGHRAEIWAVVMDLTQALLLFVCVDAAIRVFRVKDDGSTINSGRDATGDKSFANGKPAVILTENEESSDLFGRIDAVQRKTAMSRVSAMHCGVSHGETFVVVSANDKTA